MSGNTLYMKIVSPSGTSFEGKVLHAAFPGAAGEFAVFPGHAPIVSNLKKGIIKYVTADEFKSTFMVESGFVEVVDNIITVCVEN